MSHSAFSPASSSRLLPASSRSAVIPIVRPSSTRASPSGATPLRDAACTATATPQPSHQRQHAERAGRCSLVACSSSSSSPASTATATSLPPLQPLNDDYERKHTFGDFANWLIPGVVMLGRYPYCEPSRCTSYDKGEAQLEKIIESGITTFVSLQAEVPAQTQMTLAGVDGFLPYKATAELIKSAHSPPPSMEVMMNLRNPTLDKFLPPKKRQASEDKPSYELQFVHFPIVDLGIPDAKALEPFVQQLIERVAKGEKLYIHCWGGRGRAGTVGAYLLGKAYGISADEALERVQRAFNTRQDNKERSPETEEQIAFVRALLA